MFVWSGASTHFPVCVQTSEKTKPKPTLVLVRCCCRHPSTTNWKKEPLVTQMQSPFYFKFYSFFRSHRSEKQRVLHQRLEWAKEIKALYRNLSKRIYDAFFFFFFLTGQKIILLWNNILLAKIMFDIYITLSWHILLNVTFVSREVFFSILPAGF